MIENLLLFIVSFVANLLSAFSGGGAGLVQLPVLIFLGLPFGIALATHKIASVALGLGATIRHVGSSQLERDFILLILVAGLPAVIIGANTILSIDDRHAEIALGYLTLALGLYSLCRQQLGQHYQPTHRDFSGYLIGGAGIILIGLLNGSLTSGSGLFLTMWLIHWFGLDYQRAVAYTLVLVGLVWNGAGALTLGLLSAVKWEWLPVLLAGSLLGGYAGAHFSITQGSRWIKRVFEVVTLLLGVKLILG